MSNLPSAPAPTNYQVLENWGTWVETSLKSSPQFVKAWRPVSQVFNQDGVGNEYQNNQKENTASTLNNAYGWAKVS